MAQRTVVMLTDDLDGDPIDEGKGETVRFALDHQEYEIDLRDQNAKALRDNITKYVGVARRVGGGSGQGRGRRGGEAPASSASSSASTRDYDPKAVRAWAQEQHIEVPARGRIPGNVVVQFKEATSRG